MLDSAAWRWLANSFQLGLISLHMSYQDTKFLRARSQLEKSLCYICVLFGDFESGFIAWKKPFTGVNEV